MQNSADTIGSATSSPEPITWNMHDGVFNLNYASAQAAASLLSSKSRRRRLTAQEASFLIMSTRYLTKVRDLENAVFSRYLRRSCVEIEEFKQSDTVHGPRKEQQVVRMRPTHNQGLLTERIRKLTAEQKCMILQSETEEQRKRLMRLEKKMKSKIFRYKMKSEALAVSLAELAKQRTLFEKCVTKNLERIASNPLLSGMRRFIIFERYHKSYLLRAERVTGCLKLKNASLRRELKRFNNAIREGENMGEPAEAIDLEHMEVLCHQSIQRLHELEVQCLEVKAQGLKLNQLLTDEKAEIASLLAINKQLCSDTERAVATTIRLKNDIARNRQLVREEQTAISQLHRRLDTYKVPPTYDYANLVASITKLARERLILERKKAVAQLKLKTHKRMWHRIVKRFG